MKKSDLKKYKSISLEKMQDSLLEDMKEFDRVCKELGCTYFLAYGTLLGAVRHNGFIPWDDDVDVWMFRKDFDKFVAHAQDVVKDNYFVQTALTDKKYDIAVSCKLRNNNTTLIENWNKKYHQGGYVDVFALDYIGDNPDEYYKLKGKCMFLQSLKMRISFKELSGIKKYIRIFLQLIFKLVPMSTIYKYVNKKIDLVRDNDKSKNTEIMNGFDDMFKDKFKAEQFLPVAYHDFGGYKFMVPHDSDAVLKTMFGDYMKLPPESEREAHGLFYGDKNWESYR